MTNHVSQVWLNEDGSVNWEWSTSLTGLTNGTGLTVNGEAPDTVNWIGGTDVVCTYPSTVNVDDPWHLNPAAVTMTFTNGGIVAADSGTVVTAP